MAALSRPVPAAQRLATAATPGFQGTWNFRRAVIGLLVLALLPALLVGYIPVHTAISEASVTARQDAIRSATLNQRLAVTSLAAGFSNMRATLAAAASFDAVQQLDIDTSAGVLGAFTRTNPFFQQIDLIDAQARTLMSSSSGVATAVDPMTASVVGARAPYVDAALQGDVAIATGADGADNSGATLMMAVPVRRGIGGEVVGALVARLSLLGIANVLMNTARISDADLVIVDGTGTALASVTQRPSLAAPLASIEGATANARPADVTALTASGSGRRLWLARDTIPGTPLIAIAAAVEGRGVSGLAIFLTGGYVALGIAFVILFAIFLSRWLLVPVTSLTETARAVTAGDHTRRVGVSSRLRELLEIGNAFNEMLDELAEQRDELVRSREQVRHVLQRTYLVQEDERRRISLDLHDRVAQLLIGALYELQSVPLSSVDDATVEAAISSAAAALRLAEAEMHRVIFELRPPSPVSGGLSGAIRAFMDEQRDHFAACFFRQSPDVPELDERSAAVAYRVVQEAIRNAAKHASGSRLSVEIRHDDRVVEIRVVDDGPGIKPSALQSLRFGRLGISGMQERVRAVSGSIAIGRPATATHGTSVVLRLPTDSRDATGAAPMVRGVEAAVASR